MEITENPSEIYSEEHEAIKNFIDHDTMTHLLVSVLGCADLMAKCLLDKWYLKDDLPVSTKYGILMFSHYYQNIGEIVREEVKPGDEIICGYLPVDGDAWKTDEDFEKRILHFVKYLYEQYKEQGKL
jgi:hypothetical protein